MRISNIFLLIKCFFNVKNAIKGVVNGMNLFKTSQRINHSHGRRTYHRPNIETKPLSLSWAFHD
jgi:hypothetical protein